MKMKSVNTHMMRIVSILLTVCACALLFGCSAAPQRENDAGTGKNIYNWGYNYDTGNAGKNANNRDYNYDTAKGGQNAYVIPGINNPTADVNLIPIYPKDNDSGNKEEQPQIEENSFVKVSEEPTSTFSSDVDTASYALFRSLVNSGYAWQNLTDGYYALRTEEMVNYFDYDCPAPDGKLFGMKATLAKSPYGDTHLLKLTLATEKTAAAMQNNLVFLIDVSGSMMSDEKLPLLKKAFRYLVNQLGEDDVISIVTYSGKEQIVLSGCKGSDRQTILSAIDSLEARGVTNGEAGLTMAYSLAADFYIEGGNNRIFLASDGDLNVGIRSSEELKRFVEEKRNGGVYLSVLGFGQGNYKDDKMETLADNGNGVYYYIDGETEAKKVFEEDLFSTLYTVAGDVKLQITFHPDAVESYRLVGYENRKMANEDFENDRKDAGELGAGHKITVFYELVLKEGADISALPEIAKLAVRYKKPGENVSIPEEYLIPGSVYTTEPDDDFLFAAAVAECSLLMRNSAYKGNASFEHLAALLGDVDVSGDPYKEEFKTLVARLTDGAQ